MGYKNPKTNSSVPAREEMINMKSMMHLSFDKNCVPCSLSTDHHHGSILWKQRYWYYCYSGDNIIYVDFYSYHYKENGHPLHTNMGNRGNGQFLVAPIISPYHSNHCNCIIPDSLYPVFVSFMLYLSINLLSICHHVL